MIIDMRHLLVAKYNEASGSETYTSGVVAGKAMAGTLELEYDSGGKIYADSAAIDGGAVVNGGKVTIGAHRLTLQVLALLGGHTYVAATTGENPTPEEVIVNVDDCPSEVGFGFTYIEKDENKVRHYYAVFLPRVMFTSPKRSYKTRGKTSEYQTPTLEGELYPNVAENYYRLTEHASVADALAWIKTKLSIVA